MFHWAWRYSMDRRQQDDSNETNWTLIGGRTREIWSRIIPSWWGVAYNWILIMIMMMLGLSSFNLVFVMAWNGSYKPIPFHDYDWNVLEVSPRLNASVCGPCIHPNSTFSLSFSLVKFHRTLRAHFVIGGDKLELLWCLGCHTVTSILSLVFMVSLRLSKHLGTSPNTLYSLPIELITCELVVVIHCKTLSWIPSNPYKRINVIVCFHYVQLFLWIAFEHRLVLKPSNISF